MKSVKNPKILKTSLSTLIKKFSKNDVVAELEKEYQHLPSKNIPTSLIDDNAYIKRVKLQPEIIDRFGHDIAEKGFFSPLVVRVVGNHYELILGRKRFYGARKAKITSVPCAIADVSDEEMLLMLLADTRDQRASNVVEMALLCQALSDKYHYTQQTLANLTHQSRSQITNTMRILRLPEPLLEDLCLGKLSYGHAKAIVSLSQDEITEIVGMIYEHHLSVREVERIAKRYAKNSKVASNEEDALAHSYGASNVDIKKRSVAFSFNSEEDKRAFLNAIAKK
ncbi:MAG: putative chromosome-partitioning protein ParB [Tenericutes bacterium ADurb.BinA155]|jgi:ParB family transcriptional regulator, chromosome partitioning protein|nr:MAG: putative chromosome-partitioning protein ParB [Tenericutes bacterium ADurb.BinA155]